MNAYARTSTLDEEAFSSGAAAGQRRTTALIAFLTGVASLAFPGAGFIYLVFLQNSQVSREPPEHALLRDKTPAYIATWKKGYDCALTQKQRRAILTWSAIGSVVGALFYTAMLAT